MSPNGRKQLNEWMFSHENGLLLTKKKIKL